MIYATADLHFTEKCPARRNDESYSDAAIEKFSRMLTRASCDNSPVIVAGDFFDKSVHTPELVNKLLSVMENCESNIYILMGNHDVRYHNSEYAMASSWKTLDSLENVRCVSRRWNVPLDGHDVTFFPYDDDLENVGHGEIAVIHKMAWHVNEPFPGAPASGNIKALRKKFQNYKLVICGDNHEQFYVPQDHDECLPAFLNCGSMMRSAINQIDHIPHFHEIDLSLKVKHIPFPIKEDVWAEGGGALKDLEGQAIENAVNNMSESTVFNLDFRANVNRAMSSEDFSNISEQTKRIIEDALDQ